MPVAPGIIDCYVNSNPPGDSEGQWTGVRQLFAKSNPTEGWSAQRMVDKMDELGIERCLLSVGPGLPEDDGKRWVLETIQRYRVQQMAGVPTMFVYLLNYPEAGGFDTSSMKLWGSVTPSTLK